MSGPLVVEAVRSGTVESTHLVDVAVVDRRGAVVARAGDPAVPAAFRSSAKPIQARVAREAGWMPRDDRALAIACASHNGEPAHVEAARAILSAAGLDDGALLCPPEVPFDPPSALAATTVERIYHNCSGKHASMLATCVAAGWPLVDYRAPDHPLQRLVRDDVAARTGIDDPPSLTDGCGVPTFVAPLHALARAFASIDDDGPEAKAMRAHPFLVGGTGRFDTDLMTTVPHALSKAGAEGLGCVAIGDVAIAVKVRDGTARARPPALVHVLRALGEIDDDAVAALAPHAAPPVLGGGEPVGVLRVAGALDRR